MKEEFKGGTWNDFKQRYQGTYGWYEKENGARMLTLLSSVRERELTFVDEQGFKFTANADKGNVFTFLPIERGCYNFGKDDVIISRRTPARQWKRGICQENTHLFSLRDNFSMPVDFPVLREMFGEAPNVRLEAFKKALIGNLAFNKTFALVHDTLYLYENKIGTYSNKEFVLTDKLFQQEVNDLVAKNQLPIVVRVGGA